MTGRLVQGIDAALNKLGLHQAGVSSADELPQHAYKADPSGAKMLAAIWEGKRDIAVRDVPKPAVTDPGDAIIRVTAAAICGSDLHLYLRALPGMKHGDIMGHETIGVVETVGPDVKKVKPGDRVVVAFCISCGECYFCKSGITSACDKTNPSKAQEAMYGQATAGIYGYSHLTGGFAGGQAEFLRVPLADNNCLVLPPRAELSDEDAVMLADILPTAFHANEMGEVGEGDVVAIWGAGPVGLLCAHVAQRRKARRVILIDEVPERLERARQKLPGVEAVDYKHGDKGDTLAALTELCKDEPGRAPDVCIEAAGMHYTKSLAQQVMVAMQAATHSADMLNECIKAARKGGRVSIVGVYAGHVNGFAIGAFMEKNLTARGGQTPVQSCWPKLLPQVLAGELRPADVVVSHVLPLREAARGYQLFNDKAEGTVKVVLKPPMAEQQQAAGAAAAAGGEAAGDRAPAAATT